VQEADMDVPGENLDEQIEETTRSSAGGSW
jgi:hypothetical protein